MSRLRIGEPAPDFTMTAAVAGSSATKTVSLADYRGRWLALFCYPLDFTAVCPTEILSMSDQADSFTELGAEVLGCSTDSVYSHQAWMRTDRKAGGIGPIRFPLASDMTRSVSREYGVLSEEQGYAHRGLFLIDPEGVVQYMTMTAVHVGRSTEETLRVLQALQTGGMCPSDWKPGTELIEA